jgi:choline dehydrogenase-like flavoprotein
MPYIAGHSFDFWLTTEDTPSPNNRVTLTLDNKIKLNYEPTNIDAHEELKKALKTYLDRIGFLPDWLPNNAYFGSKMPVEITAHQCGTLRFGKDSKTFVVDENLKVHELDNLYVVDGSVFPSSTSTNPGLTIMALAIRAGEYLTNKIRENENYEFTLSGTEY